jgi:ribulose kinase
MNKNGYKIDTIFITGGSSKNRIFVREHADITGDRYLLVTFDILGCKVVLPIDGDAVILGSGVLGAVASGDFKSILEAMQVFNRVKNVISPSGGKTKEYHADKYSVFLKMYEDQMSYRNLMEKWK